MSLLGEALAQSGGEITFQLANGQLIKVMRGTQARGIGATAQILDARGRIINASPSGTFALGGGKSIILQSGKVIGGSDTARQGAWLAFALLPANPTQRGPGSPGY
jgi:hypothetical protein